MLSETIQADGTIHEEMSFLDDELQGASESL